MSTARPLRVRNVRSDTLIVSDAAMLILSDAQADLAAAYLPGLDVEVVEGDLFPVDIQPAYHGHRDLLTLRRAVLAARSARREASLPQQERP